MILRLLIASCFLVAVGCGPRTSMHYRIGDDGSFRRVEPETIRDDYQRALAADLQSLIDDTWLVQVSIMPLPVYSPDEERFASPWRWQGATVAIRVIGDGSAKREAVEESELTGRVRSRMWDMVDGRLEITSTVVVADPDAVTALRQEMAAGDEQAASEPAATSESVPSTAEPRRYVIQAGDTLATLSVVFYGDASHWRRILEANPALSAERPLPVGEAIVLP